MCNHSHNLHAHTDLDIDKGREPHTKMHYHKEFKMSSKFADNTATEFDSNEDDQPEILSNIPVYSEINPKRESSPPHVETFENQAYSINTLVNTHSKSSQKANPATPSYDHVL